MTKRIVLLQALASTPQDISRMVGKLDDDAAAWRPEGGWSCRDVVSHLCYVERLYLARIRRVMDEDEPAVEAIHPNESAHDLVAPISTLAQQFHEAREATLATLQELSPGAWQRAARHESKGRMTLRFLIQDLISHDIEHTNQLAEVQSRRRTYLRRESAAAAG